MAILTLEDQTGSIEVVVFPDAFERYSPLLKSDEPLLVTGTAEVDESAVKIIAQEIQPLKMSGGKPSGSSSWPCPTGHQPGDPGGNQGHPFPLSRRIRGPVQSEYRARQRTAHRRSPPVSRLTLPEMIREIETLIGQKVVCSYGEKNHNPGQFAHPQFFSQS
jgi:hypothetical protein